jgi:hypothetical protein
VKVKEGMRLEKGHLEVLKKNIAKHLDAYTWLIDWMNVFLCSKFIDHSIVKNLTR